MELDEVVPWGRSFEEYCLMFELSETDLRKPILGCADGPASFNAELTRRKGKAVSVDPIYQFSAQQIKQRIKQAAPKILDEVEKNNDQFLWKSIANIQALENARMQAMDTFLNDYEMGLSENRYVGASLPVLPFEKGEFELALCSHYLFLYSEKVDEKAHVAAIKELKRVAAEVRIYPLVDLNGEPSPHIEAVLKWAAAEHKSVRCSPVSYQFQKGAIEMLVIKD